MQVLALETMAETKGKKCGMILGSLKRSRLIIAPNLSIVLYLVQRTFQVTQPTSKNNIELKKNLSVVRTCMQKKALVNTHLLVDTLGKGLQVWSQVHSHETSTMVVSSAVLDTKHTKDISEIFDCSGETETICQEDLTSKFS